MKYDTYLHGLYSLKNTSTYKRPSDWLALPEVQEGDNKFIGLYPVSLYSSVSFTFSISASGTYTVNWGDNTSNTYSSGAKASHIYDYSLISDSTLCSRGFKQAIITVIPESGKKFTSISFSSNSSGNCDKEWLDINLVGSSITSLSEFKNSYLLERFNYIGTNMISSFSLMFSCCSSLKEISSLYTHNGTDFSYMFSNCYSLQNIPLIDTHNGINFSNMFEANYSLLTIPLIDTYSGTSFYYMFNDCYSLQTIPLLDTHNGGDFSMMFGHCYSLQTIPLFNIINGTNFTSTFYVCRSLQIVPSLNVSSGTSFTRMFDSCTQLKKAALSGTKISVNYSYGRLSKEALVDIFNGLASGVSGQTITISGNPGASLLTADDRLIATNKGWTISG